MYTAGDRCIIISLPLQSHINCIVISLRKKAYKIVPVTLLLLQQVNNSIAMVALL